PLSAQKPLERFAVVSFLDYSTSSKFSRFVDGLPDLLSQELGIYKNIQMIERIRIDEVLKEIRFSREKEIDPITASKIGKILGAQAIILGGLYEAGGKINLSARVVSVETAEIVHGVCVIGEESNIFVIIKALARKISLMWSGELSIITTPEATIYINGQNKGKTPRYFGGVVGLMKINLVPLDSKYESYEENIDLKPGETKTINKTLALTQAGARQINNASAINNINAKIKDVEEIETWGYAGAIMGVVWFISAPYVFDEADEVGAKNLLSKIGIGSAIIGAGMIIYATIEKSRLRNIIRGLSASIRPSFPKRGIMFSVNYSF
ncbi:MAG: PEGA domain-containing protein, partial [Candidatus Aminicenantes bacterium]|nr:PEGA domain-containing protein [Candidatus Aminicenantes bacterium]